MVDNHLCDSVVYSDKLTYGADELWLIGAIANVCDMIYGMVMKWL